MGLLRRGGPGSRRSVPQQQHPLRHLTILARAGARGPSFSSDD
jgi:hypothetical protein